MRGRLPGDGRRVRDRRRRRTDARRADTWLFTDGRALLASEPAGPGPATLVAFAPSDGRRLWEATLPDSVVDAWEMGRQLVGQTQDGGSTVVLG